jgi:hypothetical protein
MRSIPLVATGLSVCLSLLSACGGGGDATSPTGNGNENPGGTNGQTGTTRFTATIDGKAWSAASAGVLATQISPVSGNYLISGFDAAPGTSISISIGALAGPGTYPLGVDGVSVAGGFAGVTTLPAAQNWNTAMTGAAGTITITALTAQRIAGTFSFTAAQVSGGATGSRVVTNGSFDVPFRSAAVIRTLPDSIGSKMTGTLNGQAWNAAIVSGQTSSNFISLSGINAQQTILFTIPLPTVAGTYALSNVAPSFVWATDPTAVRPAGTKCCWGIQGDVGSVTFTSLTKTRVKGTFSATLRPQPGTAATGTLTITNASFDIGMFHTP